jgi:hypothetical protein
MDMGDSFPAVLLQLPVQRVHTFEQNVWMIKDSEKISIVLVVASKA